MERQDKISAGMALYDSLEQDKRVALQTKFGNEGIPDREARFYEWVYETEVAPIMNGIQEQAVEIEKYKFVNQCEDIEQLVEAARAIAPVTGRAGSRVYDSDKLERSIRHAFDTGEFRYVTRAFGLRQQAMYIYHTEAAEGLRRARTDEPCSEPPCDDGRDQGRETSPGKTVTWELTNVKDTSWSEAAYDIMFEDFRKSHPYMGEDDLRDKFYSEVVGKYFEYGEFADITIVIGPGMKIVGGEIKGRSE